VTDVLIDSDRGGRLSTQPEPPSLRPSGRGPIPFLRLTWRRLTSMRTALLLLALLALAAIPGTVIPQTGIDPVKVDNFIAAHRQLGPVMKRLSLFNVFGSPWFAAIYLLLFVSLIGCLVPRIRLHARALMRRPPNAPRHLQRLPTSAGWTVEGTPEEFAARARSELRHRRWRADVRPEADGVVTIAAEKGYLRETGNLVFHVALLLLLAGIALGGLFGYKGTALVTQNGHFANVQDNYDVFSPSRLFSDSSLSPFSFSLTKFTAQYQPGGEPTFFNAAIQYKTTPDAPAKPYNIAVNHPLDVGGAKVFLVGHGYSMHLTVSNAKGQPVFDQDVPFLPDDGQFLSHGVVKVLDGLGPQSSQQVGMLGFFYPTYAVTTTGQPVSTFPGVKNPVLSLIAYRGDLGVNNGTAESVYSLPITNKLTQIGTKQLTPGSSWKLKDGATVRFDGINQWATFQVAHEPGKTTMLAAAILIVAGLIGSLFVRRRRFWVRAVPVPAADGGTSRRTVVTAAGLGRNDVEGFAAEHRDLVARLGRTEADGSAVDDDDRTEEG
jgi:cytochrome c biogenesis protein